MLIEKPRCNFKNCRYCFDGNCFSADKYENCKVIDLHSEIAKLTVDLDNAKAEVAKEVFEEIEKKSFVISETNHSTGVTRVVCYQISGEEIAELKKKYTEGESNGSK